MFDHIFADAPPETFVEVSKLPSTRLYVQPNQIAAAVAQLGDTDIYYAPALRKARGSEKEDVFGTRVLWADVDRPQTPLTTFPPSIVVKSGGGWHLYWLLDVYAVGVDDIETANKALTEDTDGDHCWNANRLLRVPGTVNSKYGPDVRAELGRVAGTVYRLEDFTVLSRLDSKSRHKIRTGDRRGFKSRSERDWNVVEDLVIAGATDDLITLLFTLQPVGDKYRAPDTNGAEYLKHTIEQVREKSRNVKVNRRVGSEIVEGEDGYFVDRTKGRMRLSTFLIKPTILLESADEIADGIRGEDVIVGDIVASNYTWKDIPLPRSAFNDRRSLDKHLRVSAWSWLGRDDDVRALLPFLLKQLQDAGLPRTRSTSVLGRHANYFVGNKQTLDGDVVYDGINAPIVHHALQREGPRLCFTEGVQPDLGVLAAVNTPAVVWNLLGWFMATPYKPVLESLGYRFPILNVYGTRGSGKTTMIKMLQRMLGYETPTTYDCNTTRFVTLTLLGSANAVPVAFSEFRQATAANFIRFVLLSYDTGHDPRGRADQTTVDHPLTAPFSLDGEDLVNDAACKERMIAVNMSPETIAEGTPAYEAFNALRAQPLQNFALPYLQHTLTVDAEAMLAQARDDIFAAFREPLPDRVRNNMIVVRFGQLSFWQHLQQPARMDVREIFEPVLQSVWSSKLGRSPTLVDEFVTGVVNAAARGRGDFQYSAADGVLWFHLASAFDWWMRQRRMTNQATLDREAIRTQLLERDIVRGEKGQYVVTPKMVGNYWCYGVDLTKAVESGLDVPASFTSRTLTF